MHMVLVFLFYSGGSWVSHFIAQGVDSSVGHRRHPGGLSSIVSGTL